MVKSIRDGGQPKALCPSRKMQYPLFIKQPPISQSNVLAGEIRQKENTWV